MLATIKQQMVEVVQSRGLTCERGEPTCAAHTEVATCDTCTSYKGCMVVSKTLQDLAFAIAAGRKDYDVCDQLANNLAIVEAGISL